MPRADSIIAKSISECVAALEARMNADCPILEELSTEQGGSYERLNQRRRADRCSLAGASSVHSPSAPLMKV